MDKILNPGSAPEVGEIFVHVKIEEKELSFRDPQNPDAKYIGNVLSITGVEGPKKNGDAYGGCGQINPVCVLELSPGWNDEMLRRLNAIWDRWHLNDMRAGCEHQRRDGWRHCPGHYQDPAPDIKQANEDLKRDGVALVRGHGKHYYCTDKNAPDGPRCEGNMHPLCEPCPECGYKYGSAWLYEPLSDDVIAFLESLPETDTKPAWI